MEVEERDPVSGRETTGHEWNGIKELDTPVPRGVLIFLIVTHVWALRLVVPVPAWPLGTTYTKGLLGIDQQQDRRGRSSSRRRRERAAWMKRASRRKPTTQILADEDLMQTVRSDRPAALRRQLRRLPRPRRQGRRQLSRPHRRRLAVGRRPGD